MLYPISRALLFKLDAETAHHLSIGMLKRMGQRGVQRLFGCKVPDKPVELFGITFPNPVGLSAGLDKNGECIGAWRGMGFGFIEIGTVTPVGQPGNPKPRMYRLPEHDAIINRLGFNNKGVEHLVAEVKKARAKYGPTGVLGINIGKNKNTPLDDALSDYRFCMKKVYAHADYITINISSPNTPGLRKLQVGVDLQKLLEGLKTEQAALHQLHGKYVPLLVKVAPDMGSEEIRDMAQAFLENQIDGVIATNTTSARQAVAGHRYANEEGGLSGAPVRDRSTEVIAKLYAVLGEQIPIIGVGGIASAEDAIAKREAGAKLVQIYTGFIYQGPQLIKDIVDAW